MISGGVMGDEGFQVVVTSNIMLWTGNAGADIALRPQGQCA